MEHRLFKIMMVAAALLVLCPGTSGADNADGGTTSPFEIGAGCRIISMGGVAAANKGDAFVMLWNPAWLEGVDRIEIDLFHTPLFDESTSYSSILASYPFVDFGVVSVGVLQLRVGDIERRDSENRLITEDLNNIQTRYLIGYARHLYREVAIGVNLKIDRFVQGSYVANGFGIDAGIASEHIIRSSILDGVRFGASIDNLLEPRITLASEEAGDPIALRFGVAVHRSIGRSNRALVAVDVHKTRYSDTQLHLGMEYVLRDMFAVRGGWECGIPTFGFGFDLGYGILDYAYRSTDLGGNHLFSLTFKFGYSRAEKLLERNRRIEEEIQNELEVKMRDFEREFVTTAMERGDSCLNSLDYRSAEEEFNRVLLWSPDHEDAKHKMNFARSEIFVQHGDSLMQSGSPVEALFHYNRAMEVLPREETQGMIDECERIIEAGADRQRVAADIFAQSLEFYAEHKWDEAKNGFDKVLEYSPEHAHAREYVLKTKEKIREERDLTISKIENLISKKRYAAALEKLRTAAGRYPADTYFGSKFEDVQHLHAAIVERETDAAIKKDSPQTQILVDETELRAEYDLGYNFFKRGDFRNAIGVWEKVWAIHPEFDKLSNNLIKAYQYMGMELYAKQRYEQALDMWGRILRIDPENSKAHRYIARTKEELLKLEGLTN